MNFLASRFAAPAVLAALTIVGGCSSDDSSEPNNSAGANAAGASSAGKAGSAGGSSDSVSTGAAGNAGLGGIAVGGSAGSTSAAGSAGAGTAGGPTAEASFVTVKSIIAMSCFGSGCHFGEGNPLQMDVSDNAKLYSKLTTYTTQNCGKLVNPTSPAESAIVRLLKGPCNGTDRMPYKMCFDGDTDYPCVSPENIALIQAWIAKGAPQQ